MNRSIHTLCAAAFALVLSTPAFASSNSIDTVAAGAVSSANPNTPVKTTTENNVGRALGALANPAPAAALPEWFQDPSVYVEYGYTTSQDNRIAGLDGDLHQVVVGLDFVAPGGFVVGGSYTATVESLSSETTFGPEAELDSNSHFFSLYTARNYWDWVNVGLTTSYGYNDRTFDVPSLAFLRQDIDSDTLSVAPFIGVGHTWGAFSWSTTPTYLFSYEAFEVETAAGFTTKTHQRSETLLVLNKFAYALSDRWILGAHANYINVASIYRPAAPTVNGPEDRSYFNLGGKVSWVPAEKWELTVGYDADVANRNYDNHRIRGGLTYSF